MAQYIFITGGVVSSVGKGIAAASIGKILQMHGISVAVQKLDPYINVDPGTLSPYQHGEVFVTNDGAETDLDLGHYERFLNINLKRSCSVTSGQIYAHVIEQERNGNYHGRTIQVVPHITQAIKNAIKKAADEMKCDVLLVEIGGTVGDIESNPFLEAIRQLRTELPRKDTFFVHLTWLVHLAATGELKTKPSQHSLKELRSLGIIPDAVIMRADQEIPEDISEKLSHFVNVPSHAIFRVTTGKNPYEVPLLLEEQNFSHFLLNHLNKEKIEDTQQRAQWQHFLTKMQLPRLNKITIGLVGKYVELHDSYLSIKEALHHAALAHVTQITIKWIHAEDITEDTVDTMLSGCDGVLVPGGFGNRAVEGKIIAALWAHKNKKPYFGICLGMQVLCIAFARMYIDKNAHSLECDPATTTPIITLMDGQELNTGGTMRLGEYPCKIIPATRAAQAYKNNELIYERHRHRFEFNNTYKDELEKNGLVFSGISPDGSLVEIVEAKNHPFMVATQFHPEFLSRPTAPHPLFTAFIESINNIYNNEGNI